MDSLAGEVSPWVLQLVVAAFWELRSILSYDSLIAGFVLSLLGTVLLVFGMLVSFASSSPE